MSVRINGERLEIFGSDGSYTRCELATTEFRTMGSVTCPQFESDLFMIPKEPLGEFGDIIVLPPNVLYWTCATPA